MSNATEKEEKRIPVIEADYTTMESRALAESKKVPCACKLEGTYGYTHDLGCPNGG